MIKTLETFHKNTDFLVTCIKKVTKFLNTITSPVSKRRRWIHPSVGRPSLISIFWSPPVRVWYFAFCPLQHSLPNMLSSCLRFANIILLVAFYDPAKRLRVQWRKSENFDIYYYLYFEFVIFRVRSCSCFRGISILISCPKISETWKKNIKQIKQSQLTYKI